MEAWFMARGRAIGDSDWKKKAGILPKFWKEHTGMWAAPHHHTCSYMAMFPPQLPHYFIQRFTEPGDIVLDPFCGRGTTPVQAVSQSRIGVGNDLNDLAYVLTKGKLANPTLKEIETRLDNLEEGFVREEWMRSGGRMQPIPLNIRMIYHRETLRHLMYLRRELDWKNDDVDTFLTMVLMGAMHGSSSGFLSLSMPNTFSMSPNYVEKYIEKNGLEKPDRDAFQVIRERCNRFLRKGPLPGSGRAIHGDVRDLNESVGIEPGSVRLIFSSPPYLKIIKYGMYNWIRLWWLLGEHKSVDGKLDDAHSIKPYIDFMGEVFKTTMPLLDPHQGIACWVIGDVQKKNVKNKSVASVNLAEKTWESLSEVEALDANGKLAKYRLLGIFEDSIPKSSKVTRIWKSKTDKSGKATVVDRILIICHEDANPLPLLSNDEITWEPFS